MKKIEYVTFGSIQIALGSDKRRKDIVSAIVEALRPYTQKLDVRLNQNYDCIYLEEELTDRHSPSQHLMVEAK